MKLKTLKNVKKLSFLLCITILFQLFGLGGIKTHAANQTKVTYTINGEAKVGNIVDIIVNISDVTNLYAGSIDFIYDESLLEVQSISKGNIFENKNLQEPIKQVKNGQANIAFTLTGSDDGVSGNGTIAIIKAKVLKEGIANLNTTNSNDNLSLDNSTVRVKLVNSNEESINYNFDDTNINLKALNSFDTLTPGVYSNSNSNLNYTSNWNNIPDSQAYTNIANESISFTFEGTGFAWYSVVAANRGIANVYIDDQLVKSVDTYSQDVVEDFKAFEVSNLNYSKHTAKIVVTGNKSDASSDSYISIKSIKVFEKEQFEKEQFISLNAGSYNNMSEGLKYTSNWTNVPDSQAYTNTANEVMAFTFEGTGFAWYSVVAPNRGIADVYIDNKLVKSVDTYSESVIADFKAFEISNLDNGNHNVEIIVSNNKNQYSNDYYISIKSIEIFDNVQSLALRPGSFDNMADGLNYTSNWTNVPDSQAYTNTVGETLSFNFEGTGFAWYSVVAANRGIADVYIDNKLVKSVDTYSPDVIGDFNVFEINNLNPGNHTVKIIVTGDKNESSSDYFISIKSIDILDNTKSLALTQGFHNNMTEGLNYTSNWTNVPDSQAYTNVAGDSLSFTFEGTGFAWHSVLAPNRGIADVYIDNKLVKSVDTYSPDVILDSNIFEFDFLNYGVHTAKIVVTGNKSDAASDTFISILNIEVLAAPFSGLLTSGIYDNSFGDLVFSPNWTNIHDSQAYTNIAGDTLSFNFEGTGFAWDSIVAPNRGIANIYIDGNLIKSIDTYSENVILDSRVFSISNLEFGFHTAKIIVTGDKSAAASDAFISVHNIEVFDELQIPTLTAGVYANNNESFNYTPNWTNVAGSQAYTNKSDEAVYFNFEGTGFTWNSVVAPNRGIAYIYIDSNFIKAVDTYSENVISDFKVFEINNLENKKHTVEIYVPGEKSDYSSDSFISLQSINVLN